jgi:hypothetical protein
MKLPLRDDLPDGQGFQGPADTLSGLLDVAAELGKIDPSECEIMDAFPLGVGYGVLKSYVDTVRERRGKANQ